MTSLSETTWKDKEKEKNKKRTKDTGCESGGTDADDSGGTGGEDSDEARVRTATKLDKTPPPPPPSGKKQVRHETQDQKPDQCKVMQTEWIVSSVTAPPPPGHHRLERLM